MDSLGSEKKQNWLEGQQLFLTGSKSRLIWSLIKEAKGLTVGWVNKITRQTKIGDNKQIVNRGEKSIGTSNGNGDQTKRKKN